METRRQRIAVLSRSFCAQSGGAERYAVATAAELARAHEVHVFAQRADQPLPPGVQWHRVSQPCEKPRWINQLWFAIVTWWLTRRGFDRVISHELSWHGDVQVVHVLPVWHTLFHQRQGLRLALKCLQVLTSPRLVCYLLLESLRYRDTRGRQVVVTSPSLRPVMERCFARARRCLRVVPPGVERLHGLATPSDQRDARARLGLAQGAFVLLFVGNDMRKKNLPTLLQAMEHLPAQVHLAVVGQGEHDADMRRQAALLGERVRFLGAMADVADAYRAADALVHPTLEDVYGMVVLEAISHGLPVVVSAAQYCGISAELQPGKAVQVLEDPRDANALAAAVRALLAQWPAVSPASEAPAQHDRGTHAVRLWSDVAQLLAPPRQRWLLLAHCFNMDGRAASQTITDKIPHLRAAGIELVVLSGVSGRKDAALEHYQVWPALAAGIRFELRHVLRQHLPHAALYRAAMVLLSLPLLPFMLLEKLLCPIESSWSWRFSAARKGRRLLRQRRFDLIYSTGGAFAAHWAARDLQKSSGLRWLAEVHDPLVMPGHTPTTAQEKAQARVERVICQHADVAIWFTEQAVASARQRNPALGERGHCMLPGVDNPFGAGLPPYQPGDKMVVGHFGSLSPTRNLTPFLRALEELVCSHPEWADKIELQVTGGPLDPVSAQYLAQSPVQGMVRHLGRIETDPQTGESGRSQILRRMRSCDVLLLLHGEEPICAEYIPSKMYEYLWMQRPILATVHGNAQMAEILRGAGHRVVDGMGDNPAWGLKPLLSAWQGSGLVDLEQPSPHTTQAAVAALLEWVGRTQAVKARAEDWESKMMEA
ncbi:MAG: glycosyltransferase family 4 protein [Rhodoferax sp.]